MSEPIQDTPVSVDETTLSSEKEIVQIPKYRFDEVSSKYKQAQAELEEFKLNQKKIQEEQALEQSNFKELYEQREKELNEFKQSYQNEKLNNLVISEASKYNPNDIDLILKVIEKDKFISETGEIKTELISEEISKLTENKPFLFKQNQPNFGNARGGNPENTKSLYFKESQLTDSEFVAKNLSEIKQASKEGRILIGE